MTKQKTKVDPEIVRARNRARSHFRREAKAYEERSLTEAREALRRATYFAGNQEYRAQRTRTDAIVRWVTTQAQTVFASLDIKPRIDISTTSHESLPVAKAYTNFEQITVALNTYTYNEDKPADVARLIALTKGLLYHEGGHILYTIPVPNLLASAMDQGCEYDLMNTPILKPDVFDGVGQEDDITVDIHTFRWVWNLLEDQRMECAVVRMSPIIERYLQVVVLDLVAKSAEQAPWRTWPFVTGRSYLPKNILSQYRSLAIEHAVEHDLVSTLTDIDRLVRAYKRATTEREMVEIIVEAVPVIYRWLGSMSGEGQVDDHNERSRQGAPSPSDSATDSDPWAEPSMPNLGRKPKPSDSKTDDEQGPSPVASVDESGDDESDATSGSDTDSETAKTTSQSDNSDEGDEGMDGGSESEGNESEQSSPGNGSTINGGENGERSEDQRGLEDEIKDAQSQIIDELISDETLSSLAGEVNDAIARGIAYDPSIQPMSPELIGQAEDVRAGMLDTLEPLAVQADPSWRFRQESGVLDPTAFVNREDGESDFWIGLDDSGAKGHDLAVSVVLDVSYSMGNHTDALSVSALGIRGACDDLGIPCTLSTFASSGYLWMNADDPTELTMVHAHGGTEPMEALEDLTNQRFDKNRHLVVVFTDGEWSGVPSFDQYREPGTYIIGVGFGWGVTEDITKRRPDAVVELHSVSQLPEEVTKALVGYLL